MKLDEAIKRFESVKLYKNFEEYIEDCGDSRVKDGIKICGNPVNSLLFRGYGICDEDHCPDYKKCVERAEEHRQFAEWLKELQKLKATCWAREYYELPVSSLQEAIEHEKHSAELRYMQADSLRKEHKSESAKFSRNAGKSHERVAKWLEELKQLKEQWQELKETIIEARDGDGTGTQQEICKFLANYMDVLEKNVSGSENPNKWIPVSERLPKEENKSYWICTDGGYQCECRWTNVNPFWTDLTTDWHWHHMDVPQYSKVVAWMQLPEPYKAESEEE